MGRINFMEQGGWHLSCSLVGYILLHSGIVDIPGADDTPVGAIFSIIIGLRLHLKLTLNGNTGYDFSLNTRLYLQGDFICTIGEGEAGHIFIILGLLLHSIRRNSTL